MISHWHLLQSLGKINEQGIVDFSLKSFTTKNFFLHFCTSASIADYTESEKHYISKSPMPQASTKTNIYLKFKKPTSTNLRLTVVYMQHRHFVVNKDRLCFKNWDTGMDDMIRCVQRNLNLSLSISLLSDQWYQDAEFIGWPIFDHKPIWFETFVGKVPKLQQNNLSRLLRL